MCVHCGREIEIDGTTWIHVFSARVECYRNDPNSTVATSADGGTDVMF